MAVIGELEFENLLKRRDGSSNGILIFGTDEAGISALGRKFVNLFASDEEPLRIQAGSLRDAPTALEDAFKALSLFGDRRLILIEGCDETHLRWLEPVVSATSDGNFVVMKAGSLTKNSKLREAAVSAGRFHAIAVYEDSPRNALARLQKSAHGQGLTFAEGAAERFLQLAGTGRGQLDMELEKLLIYCWPSTLISEFDVEASCGEQAGFEVDSLTAAILDGDLGVCDRIFETMCSDGTWRQVLILLQMQFSRLENLRAEIDNGVDMERAFRSAKPPVFFTQQKPMARHLRLFTSEDFSQFGAALQTAILSSRQLSDLAEAIVSRAVLSLARKAHQLQRRQFQ